MGKTRGARRAIELIVAAALAIPLAVTAIQASTEPARAAGPARTAVASAFNPGYIITDGLFFNGDAMTAVDVQAFLNAKVPTCDTHHNGGGPYICLKDYSTSFSARAASGGCAAIPAGTLSAASIVAIVGKACNVSQEALLVLLQKEQSLVTDTWPTSGQYRAATGYGCPDTAVCDSKYYGFFNQVYSAAWQFRYYTMSSGFRFHAGQTINIAYSPNASCGTKSVYIQNAATAGLYDYTPYTPNAAALTNLYGTGDSCSSYGNRNFWRLYSDWFGNPTGIVPTGVTVSRISGADRYQSSAAVSAAYFSPGVAVAYVASGENFADAISAGPAAAHDKGPVLLVQQNGIPTAVAAELTRLAPKKIVVVGGPAVVSDRVAQVLTSYTTTVDRVFGQDRYGTSRAVLTYAFGASAPEVYVATGSGFADALSASAAAGSRGDPLLLLDGSRSSLDQPTQALLQSLGTTKVYIAGGVGVVLPGIQQQLDSSIGAASVVRLAGSNRYATSSAVNRERFTTAGTFFVASGEDFPDALSAAPVAGGQSFPLYITPSSCVPTALVQHIIDAKATEVVVVGGTGVVSEPATRFRNC